MYRSSEVRWFFAGELPSSVRDWFLAGDNARNEPARTDEYIRLPDCETASIKIREGRLEVKAMTKPPEPVTYATDIEGMRDSWVKWSSDAIDEEALRQLVRSAHEQRIFVTKERYLRTYSLDNDTPAVVDGSQDWLENGCQIEVTQISTSLSQPEHPTSSRTCEVAPSVWWSLSLEAFGQPGIVNANLDCIATLVFRQPPAARLPRDASLSYPAWLSRNDCRRQ